MRRERGKRGEEGRRGGRRKGTEKGDGQGEEKGNGQGEKLYSIVLRSTPGAKLLCIVYAFIQQVKKKNSNLDMYIVVSCIELLMAMCYHSIGSQTCGI